MKGPGDMASQLLFVSCPIHGTLVLQIRWGLQNTIRSSTCHYSRGDQDDLLIIHKHFQWSTIFQLFFFSNQVQL